jgi:hypothetical protein
VRYRAETSKASAVQLLGRLLKVNGDIGEGHGKKKKSRLAPGVIRWDQNKPSIYRQIPKSLG